VKPEFTELEALKMENFNLRFHVLQTNLQALGAERSTFIQHLEAKNPGWKWKDPEGWVEVPAVVPSDVDDEMKVETVIPN